MSDKTVPDRDLLKLHPLTRSRWAALKPDLERILGCTMLLTEGYRSDERQQWLFGAGRDANVLEAHRINRGWARPTEPRVTNASSAETSAHGWLNEAGQPASAAIDVVPLGADGKPWSLDDPWADFVQLTTDRGLLAVQHGLVHFHGAGKQVWDKPHLQLDSWDDATHTLRFP